MQDGGFDLVPGTLMLVGGPQQQPFGVLAAVDRATGKPLGRNLEWTCSDPDFTLEPAGDTATVGFYGSGSATVTARDPRSGLIATARVTVSVMDGGLPRIPGGRPPPGVS